MERLERKLTDVDMILKGIFEVDELEVDEENDDMKILNKSMVRRLLAGKIKSFAEKIYKEEGTKIEFLARKSGIDTELNPGEKQILHDNGILKVEKSVRNPTKKIDIEKVFEYLSEEGVSLDLLNKSKEEATKYNKPPVYITVKR